MQHTYEVEIKTLLSTKENADKLMSALKEQDSALKILGTERQINHYFNSPKDISRLAQAVTGVVSADKLDSLTKTLAVAMKLSIRTRDTSGRVILVVKASVGDDTSSNGVKRIEWEAPVSITIDELDKLLLGAGFTYQAKWSRERTSIESLGMNISIDKNAGYGYLAEFEIVTDKEAELDTVKEKLLSFMKKVGVSELPQDRLERMFAHYNAHWPEYYGTEKTFIIE